LNAHQAHRIPASERSIGQANEEVFVDGQEVVTNDGHRIGTVIAERDDCVILETGHVFKTKHAIPRAFLHEHEGVLRATVTKDVVDASPKIDLAQWDCGEVRQHYGLDGPVQLDPDPRIGGAQTEGPHERTDPPPSDRLATLGGANDPSIEGPSEFDRKN
jgi:hypothetical protein